MRSKVDFYIHNEEGELINKMVFHSLGEIDACIEKLVETRAELEHRIEMNKIKAREKRKRRMQDKANINGFQEAIESLKKAEEYYNNVDASAKPFNRMFLDSAKVLVELIDREIYGKQN